MMALITKKKLPTFKSAMVVDDNWMDLFVVEKNLEMAANVGTVHKFSNGHEALNMLNNLAGRPFPELFIIDVKMPIMDGPAFLDELGKLRQFCPVKCKVLLISAYTEMYEGVDTAKIIERFAFIDHCHEKPFKIDMLHGLN